MLYYLLAEKKKLAFLEEHKNHENQIIHFSFVCILLHLALK